MFLRVLGEDEYVVQIDKNKLIDHVSEHIIHQSLEDGQSVR